MSLLRLTGDLTIGVLNMFYYTSKGNPSITCEQGRIPVIMENTVENHEGCWVWAARTQNGYGVVSLKGESIGVHRMSYEVFVGPIPEGLLIRHRCHNRRCCNPLHLESGTDYDNWLDSLVDGRTSIAEQDGSDNIMSKLTEKQVYEIREKYKTGKFLAKELAEQYGVSRRVVERTVSGVAYSCYAEVPPYDWRDLDVNIFMNRLTRKGRQTIRKLLADGYTKKEVVAMTNFTRKMVSNVSLDRHKD